MKTIDRIMGRLAIPVIGSAAILLVVLMLSTNQDTNKDNNAYIRVINCIISKNAATRVQEDIEQCYVTVERDLNVVLRRYDSLDRP